MASGEERLARRKARMAAAPPFLRGGYRPFFFGGAAWAVTALALWLCSMAGVLALPTAFDDLAWHRHEMLFGFVGAVIAGFLLTAIPNWTGRLPIAGLPLGALAGLWLAGRLSVLFSAAVGAAPAAAIDVGFYLVLAVVGAREVLAAQNSNRPIIGILLLFGIANAVDHAAASGTFSDTEAGIRAGIALVTVMISLIGGRIIPSFTRNWMTRQGIAYRLPAQPGRFDAAVVAATALALIGWIAFPNAILTGAILVIAALLQVKRLSRWGGLRTVRDPLVFILHVGYFWVPAGLLLLGISIFGSAVPRSTALHALTAGAMATMILAVMTRATLGHTGRELRASTATIILYCLVTVGALLRVGAGLGLIDYTIGIDIAGAAWAGAFLLFLLFYGPILFSARLGDPTR